ncbi:MAG TPA: PSD1 and planctomycete cytochrome C domain-containing protein [Blastocatellia bacterium]|nr:PSD1 and planctomycete cytochrome C domain-containing protein [Blastocatellia bacterium]
MLAKYFPTVTVVKAVITFAVVVFFLNISLRSAQTASNRPAVQEPSREGLEFFEKKIRPALAENCYGCHSAQAKKPQGGLLLDSIEGMLKGGASGQPAVVPGEPEQSLLIRAIRYTDPKLQMPFAGKLPDSTIKEFEAWVKMGAPAPKGGAQPVAANWQPYNWDEARRFWSFQPIRDRRPPPVKKRSWVKTPIDQFILARLEEQGLKPLGDADRRTWLRRATFDLTGLPPTPDEIDAFLNDRSPGAFEKVVDRLLASPAYGEKWGRHWLDLVRYADTAGDNSDYPVPAAFRYRNYVIASFNLDKPYNRFIKEQLAGDLLPAAGEGKREQIIATGYLALSRRFGSRNESMNLTLDDTIDNLGKTFLGLSISCARCHDHKFDPIPTRDYYGLYGIFNSSRYSFPGAEIYPHPAEYVALSAGPEAEQFYERQKELSELDDRKERLTVEKGAAARNRRLKEAQARNEGHGNPGGGSAAEALPEAKGEVKKTTSTGGEMRSADFNRDAENSRVVQSSARTPEQIEAEVRQVKARVAELGENPVRVDKAYAVVEGLPQNSRIHRKGDPKNPGDEAPRGFLTILGGPQVPKDYAGSGRDLLADWITAPENPLTARVMVNRLWQYHFGKGLVQTPSDFGTRGRAPTHPELLDWLAARFVEGGWSIKKMHRTIMLSHAYRLASAGPNAAANEQSDVANDYLWRFDRRRLEAEEIRDAILALSGQLDRSMGAEHPFPAEKTWRFTQHEQFFAVYGTNRRSVYVMQQRLKKHPFFETFDGADQSAITDRRLESTTPIQALFLLNNPWLHEQAAHFAARIEAAARTPAGRIDYAFRLAYGRAAKPDEIQEAALYLRRVTQDLEAIKTPPEKIAPAALASYLRVLLSSNEFLYVD